MDILIIFTNGTEKVIHDVKYYYNDEANNVFRYEKNGYNNFVPKDNVLYFGRYDAWYDEEDS